MLASLVSQGDWAIDVGANVGYYTLGLAGLVGSEGRVVAFEPVLRTFALLAANVYAAKLTNVTLMNAAVSDTAAVVGMSIPVQDGSSNFYQAQITDRRADCAALTIRLDTLEWPARVALIKIDTEGHELHALTGMIELVRRDRPTLLIETGREGVETLLGKLAYSNERLPGSHNKIFRPRNSPLHSRVATARSSTQQVQRRATGIDA